MLNRLKIPFITIIDEDPVENKEIESQVIKCNSCNNKINYKCPKCEKRIRDRNKD